MENCVKNIKSKPTAKTDSPHLFVYIINNVLTRSHPIKKKEVEEEIC